MRQAEEQCKYAPNQIRDYSKVGLESQTHKTQFYLTQGESIQLPGAKNRALFTWIYAQITYYGDLSYSSPKNNHTHTHSNTCVKTNINYFQRVACQKHIHRLYPTVVVRNETPDAQRGGGAKHLMIDITQNPKPKNTKYPEYCFQYTSIACSIVFTG